MFRGQRIQKLIERGWIESAADVPADAIPVDPDRVSWGGPIGRSIPTFFQDATFICKDCGTLAVWKAEKQRLYFEMTGAPWAHQAVRCRPCRIAERERKAEARRQAGHGEK